MKYMHVKLKGWDTLRTSKISNTTTDMSHRHGHMRRDGMTHPGPTMYAKKESKMMFIVRGNRSIWRGDVCSKEAHRSSLGRSGKRRGRDDGAMDKCIRKRIPGLSLLQIPARYKGLHLSSDFLTFSSSSPSSSYGEDREGYRDANDDVSEDRIDEIDGEISSEFMLKHRLALDTSDEFAAIIYHTPYFFRNPIPYLKMLLRFIVNSFKLSKQFFIPRVRATLRRSVGILFAVLVFCMICGKIDAVCRSFPITLLLKRCSS